MLLLLLLAVIVVVNPRNPPWKFGNNRVGNSWDIADVEFPVGGGVCKVIFMSNPTVVLRLGWGFDNKNNNNNNNNNNDKIYFSYDWQNVI